MMITTSIASGPNSTKPITTQGRRYWVEKGKVANHGLALSLGRRLRNGKKLKGKAGNAESERIQQQLRAKHRSKDKEVKKNLRSDKDSGLTALASSCIWCWPDDAQNAADMGNMRALYDITKTVCNERPCVNNAINDKDGRTITDDSSRLARLKEHFKEILKRPPLVNPIVITADEVPEIGR